MNRYLPHSSHPGQASDDNADAAGSVLIRGTTARTPEPPGNPPAWHGKVTLVVEPTPPPERYGWEDDDAPIRPRDPEDVPVWARDPEWLADMEYVWSSRVRDEVKTLTERARRYRAAARALDGGRPVFVPGTRRPEVTRKQLRAAVSDGRTIVARWGHGAMTVDGRKVELLRSAEWCEARARSASMTRLDLANTCGGRWRRVACGCGPRDVPVGCDQAQLCEWCRERHWRKWRRRIVRAMGPHLRAAVEQWARRGKRGPRPGIYLVTLTAPHSGDLGTDRKVMGDAWRELSKRASYGGYYYADGNRWSERKWWGHHALVWEATDGTDGRGHLHAHVAAISQWVPYAELHATWDQAIADASGNPRVACHVDVVSPTEQAARSNARGRKANGPSDAAFYLAKYVTKGVQPGELSGRKAGELLAASRGRRKVTTSRGFWRPLAARGCDCPTCGQAMRLVGAPVGLQQHAPGAVISSAVVRSRWRTDVQTRLVLSG